MTIFEDRNLVYKLHGEIDALLNEQARAKEAAEQDAIDYLATFEPSEQEERFYQSGEIDRQLDSEGFEFETQDISPETICHLCGKYNPSGDLHADCENRERFAAEWTQVPNIFIR